MSTRASPHRPAGNGRLSMLLWAEVTRLDIPVREVARRAGLAESDVRNYFSGRVYPPATALAALERAFGRPPGWATGQPWV